MLGVFLFSSVLIKVILIGLIALVGFLISCTSPKTPGKSDVPQEIIEQIKAYEQSKRDQLKQPDKEVSKAEEDAIIDTQLKAGESFYVVRREAFFYTDEAFESMGEGPYDALFTDKETANKYLLTKQKEMVRDFSLDDLFFSSDTIVRGNLNKYFQENFSIDIRDREYKDFFSIDRDVRFPEQATEKQIDEILRIGDIKVARIVAFNSTPTFFTASPNSAFWNMLGVKPNKWFYSSEYYGKHVYNEKEEATDEFNKQSVQRFYESKIKGSLEELSDSPALLKAFIDGEERLTYNESTKEIEVRSPEHKTKLALFELLKGQPFILEEISLKEFKKMSEEFQY